MMYTISFKYAGLIEVSILVIADSEDEAIQVVRQKILNGQEVSAFIDGAPCLMRMKFDPRLEDYCILHPDDKQYDHDTYLNSDIRGLPTKEYGENDLNTMLENCIFPEEEETTKPGTPFAIGSKYSYTK